MKKAILFLSFLGLLCCANTSHAQEFNSAAGLRFGYPLSVSYKKFLNESNAFEIYAGTRGHSSWRWYSVSGAYQIHKPLEIGEIPGLSYYYGLGATAFFWSFDFNTDASTTTFGIQGYAGLSYTFENSPINVSVDWVPTYLFSGYVSGFGADYGSLSIRYILGRE